MEFSQTSSKLQWVIELDVSNLILMHWSWTQCCVVNYYFYIWFLIDFFMSLFHYIHFFSDFTSKCEHTILVEKEMETHSRILAWRILWTEEPGGLQSMGSQRVGLDWATNSHTQYLPFSTWLILLSKIPSRFIHIVAKGRFHSFLMAE